MSIDQTRWLRSHRADPLALALYERHYSCTPVPRGRVREQFVAPGACLVLRTEGYDALWVWHKAKPGLRLDEQEGVSCAVFRNEGPHRASELILEAERAAWARWPGERLFTSVDPRRVRSEVPGYAFRRPRWRRCGVSKSGLLLFEKRPEWVR